MDRQKDAAWCIARQGKGSRCVSGGLGCVAGAALPGGVGGCLLWEREGRPVLSLLPGPGGAALCRRSAAVGERGRGCWLVRRAFETNVRGTKIKDDFSEVSSFPFVSPSSQEPSLLWLYTLEAHNTRFLLYLVFLVPAWCWVKVYGLICFQVKREKYIYLRCHLVGSFKVN